MLLSTAYFPPVSWFALAASVCPVRPPEKETPSPAVVYIEACEHYRKQTYRNRCRFYSARGVDTLSVPVLHSEGSVNHPITEVLVDYRTPWVQKTKRAIVSAYMSSAFFEYYMDGLFAVLDSGAERLWDLNSGLIGFFVRKIGLPVEFRPTEEFTPPSVGNAVYGEDRRYGLSPKRPDGILAELGLEQPYFQVFARKFGFQANLSVMDLLFNVGPESIRYLKKPEPPVRRSRL